MADISIIRSHTLTHEKAKDAAQKVADQMAEEYEMNAEWDGDVLKFTRSGVSGRLVVSDKDAHVEITLGFFFKAFASTIEEKVASKMTKVFGAAA